MSRVILKLEPGARASGPAWGGTGAASVKLERPPMNLHSFLIEPLVALLAGILILVQPRLLNFIVAIYLIIVGVVGLAPHFMH
jgi:threonine/homoserine efflux transporter RhtA